MAMFESGLEIIVHAVVTHPPGTVLDAFGDPVLDADGNPIRMSQLPQQENER